MTEVGVDYGMTEVGVGDVTEVRVHDMTSWSRSLRIPIQPDMNSLGKGCGRMFLIILDASSERGVGLRNFMMSRIR